METIVKPTTINSDSAPISEESDKRILSIEEQKKKINQNYLPSLSSFQKISIKLKDEKNDDKEMEISPNVNFKKESNIGYYIFYNNNLQQLKDLYSFELKKLIKLHPIILYHIKDFLKKLDQRFDEDTYFNPIRLFSLLVSYSYQPIVEKARALANNLIKINQIENEKNGTEIQLNFSQIVIKDGVDDLFKEISDEDNFYYNPSEYTEIERTFAQLEFNRKDKLSFVKELEGLLDQYYKYFGEVSIKKEKKLFFCFILNRASFYLENLEINKSQYDLELLKECDILRRKINILLLEFRYKYVQNSKPILDIQIDRCKTLNNDFNKVSIYLDKDELKAFIKELEKSFQRKADNLRKEKNFEFLNLKEIKEIAALRDIDINSNESLKEAMQEKLRNLDLQKKAKENEIKSIYAEYLKSGITLAANFALGNQLALINEVKNPLKEKNDNNTKKGDNDKINLDKKKDEGQSRINQLQLEIEDIKNNIQNYNNKIGKINININYDVTFINILKLYLQLVRSKYQDRYDYEGLIITEEKKMNLIKKNANDLYDHYEEEEKLREYVIKEISQAN